MDPTTFVGALGAFLLLVAFVGNEFKKLTVESYTYGVLNLIGGAMLAWYALTIDSMPFLVIESILALVAFRNLFLRLAGARKNG